MNIIVRLISFSIATFAFGACAYPLAYYAADQGIKNALDSGNSAPGGTVVLSAEATVTTTAASLTNSGATAINLRLIDGDSDVLKIVPEFCINGLAAQESRTWQLATLMDETDMMKPSSPTGIDYTLRWDTLSDLGLTFNPQVRFRVNIEGAEENYAPTGIFVVDNNAQPVATITSPSGAITGDVTIAYTLSDDESNPCSILAEFSTDGGLNYQRATPGAPNAEGVTGVNASQDGVAHTFVWNSGSVDDIGHTTQNVVFRITPDDTATDDSRVGIGASTEIFTVANNDPPVVTLEPLVETLSGDVTLTLYIMDTTESTASHTLTVEYSTNGGTTYQEASQRHGATSRLLYDAVSNEPGALAVFVWDSLQDLGQSYSADVKLRVFSNDGTDDGARVNFVREDDDALSTFIVDNNEAPAIVVELIGNDENFSPPTASGGSLGKTFSDDVIVRYRLIDSNQDPANLYFSYSLDGVNFSKCTESSSASSLGSESLLSLEGYGARGVYVWESHVDITSRSSSVALRVLPTDSVDGKDGKAITTSVFAIDNSSPPTASVGTPTSPTPGYYDVPVTIFDTESDSATLLVEFATPNDAAAGNWTACTQAEDSASAGSNVLDIGEAASTSPSGTTSTFRWFAAEATTGSGSYNIRVRPSDTRQGGYYTGPTITIDNSSLSQPNQPAFFFLDPLPDPISGNTQIAYSLGDQNSDAVSLAVEYSTSSGNWTSITFESGSDGSFGAALPTSGPAGALTSSPITSSSSGTNHTLVWASATDIPTVTGGVRLRFTTTDNDGSGTPFVTSPFQVGVNTKPSVAIDPFSAASDVVSVVYSIIDDEAQSIQIDPEYSVDGGANWSPASSAANQGDGIANLTSSSSPGTQHLFAWDSRADVGAGTFSNAKFRITPFDGIENGTAVSTNVFTLINNDAPQITNVAITGNSGDVSVTYTLADSTSDVSSIVIEYSSDGGTTWTAATRKSGAGEPTTGLTTSPSGVTHLFVWKTSVDLPGGPHTGIRGRITPSDASATGSPSVSSPFTIDNTTAPTATNVAPVSSTGGTTAPPVYTGDVTISFTIVDPESQSCTILAEYSADNGSTWHSASPGAGGDAGASYQSSPTGTAGSFVWNSTDIGTVLNTQVRFRVRPTDTKVGTAGVSATFTVDNNSLANTPPQISNLNPSGGSVKSGDITISFTLSDSEGQSCSILVEYFAPGPNGSVGIWYTIAASDISGDLSSLAPGSGLSFVWKSKTTLPSVDGSGYKLRLTPTDSAGATGATVASNAFAIDNAPPVVNITSLVGGEILAGGSTHTLTWTSQESNPNFVGVSYSTDDFATYTAIVNPTNDDGSYSFTLPSLDSSNVKIALAGTDGLGNTGSASITPAFTIDSTPPAVTLTYPVGGENMQGGSSQTIAWTTSDANVNAVYIDYTTNLSANPPTWTTIATSATDTGSYPWSPPITAAGTDTGIRIRATDQAGNVGSYAIIPAPFTISDRVRNRWMHQNPYPTGNDLLGVWGDTTGTVYAVGLNGVILKKSGSSWSSESSGTVNRLMDVGSDGAGTIYAVGDLGTILKKSGSSWISESSGTTQQFRGVRGSGTGTVYAVGNGGMILKKSGTAWSAESSGTTKDLWGVWDNGVGTVYAVGNNGTILKKSGGTWSIESSGTTQHFRDVWGDGSSVWAVGDSGTILRLSGGTWSSETSGTTQVLIGVWGDGTGTVYAVGYNGTILKNTGSSWSTESSGTSHVIEGVWGDSAGSVYAVGFSGTILKNTGGGWVSDAPSATSEHLYDFNLNLSNELRAVGDNGTTTQLIGPPWYPINSGTVEHFRGINNDSSGVMRAVGANGTIRVNSGGGWTTSETSGTTSNLEDIFEDSSGTLWIVGDGGTIKYYNGSAWTTSASGTTQHLYAIGEDSAGNLYAVGNSGTIRKKPVGGSWGTQSSGTTQNLHDVWGDSSGNVYVVGWGGTILRNSGGTWTAQTSGTTTHLYSICGDDSGTLFVCGDAGVVLKNTGSGWTTVASGTGRSLYSLRGDSKNNLFAVGTYGTILHYGPFLDVGTSTDGAFDSATYTSGSIPAITKSGTTITINTSTQSEFDFTSFTLAAGVTLVATGPNPIRIHTSGDCTIDGVIDLSGGNASGNSRGIGSVGGFNGGEGGASLGGNGTNGGGPGAGNRGSSGGGGGFGTAGGGNNGGGTYNNESLTNTDIQGGSGGGGEDGGTLSSGGGGGAGGGAINIHCAGTLTIGSGGSIDVSGGNGSGGGGGGAGGAIKLQASAIDIQSTSSSALDATGGSGGNPGGDGRIRLHDDDGAVTGFDTRCAPDASVSRNW
ncbi:MAG: hypothetical protein NUW37_14330 [Planctomycetes bacterium]|nr:hypothetical protein [Planctomycetota bacterium]